LYPGAAFIGGSLAESELVKLLRILGHRIGCLLLAAAVLAGLSGCSDPMDIRSNHEIVRVPPLGPSNGAEPMVRMNSKELPDAKAVYEQIKADYYSCAGLVGAWFLELVTAEMNFLARHHGLERLDGSACALSLTKSGVGTGRIKLHLFKDATEANECVFKNKCGLARNVTLIPTSKAVLRSYFLTDFQGEKFHQHCLAPPDLWHKGVSCEYIGLEAALGIERARR